MSNRAWTYVAIGLICLAILCLLMLANIWLGG